ncbi:MAG TPA: glycosyltransferase family 4 protein [Thermoplasmata archaeon]|nr:glycosyltransferase family 4 protein [Thermoplasmata archaeon]
MESRSLAFVMDRCAPFYAGGYEHHGWSLARELAREHGVTVFTSLPEPRVEVDGVEFVRIAPPWDYTRRAGGHSMGGAAAYAFSAFARLPALRRYDSVDLLGIPYLQVPGLRLRQRWAGWPLVVTVWEAWYDYSYVDGPFGPLARRGFRVFLRATVSGRHPVLVGAERTRITLHERYGVAPDRIHVVPPGVDVRAAEAIDRPDVPESDIVYVGRLEPYKRVGDLIRAVAELARSGARPRVEIVGDGAERRNLESLARRLGVSGQIAFRGYVPEADRWRLLRGSRIFVLPSEREGFSIATLEAMAAGLCPVVARPRHVEVDAVGDLVQDGVSGASFPAGDPVALAGVLGPWLTSPETFRAQANAAQRRAREFDLRHLARRYLAAVEAA